MFFDFFVYLKKIFRINCYLGNLAFCNIVLSLGFLIYTLLIDVYYEVDSFKTIIKLSDQKNLLWIILKVIFLFEYNKTYII